MKTMLLAAAAALSLGIGSAYAAQGPADGYVYPDYIAPGSVYAGAPTAVQSTPRVATAHNDRAVHSYAANLTGLATIPLPNLCSDVRAWKAGNFTTVPKNVL